MPGFEVDSFLAFLAHLGLLRSLEAARPDWSPRSSWVGPPWEARLQLSTRATRLEVATAAAEGIDAIAARFDVDGRANVAFSREEFRRYAIRVRGDATASALAAAITAEVPEKRAGGLSAAPLVMLFGQGHQNFLDRLLTVSRGELPPRMTKLKHRPNLRDPAKLAEAIFVPWTRSDRTDAFRWDPEEDQRYALRFEDPSDSGAAPTVHGANRLATIGILSLPSFPSSRVMATPGVARDADGVMFHWPVWNVSLSRHAIERLLVHPDLPGVRPDRLSLLGVSQVYRARRVSNGKFMNVSRAMAVASTGPWQ